MFLRKAVDRNEGQYLMGVGAEGAKMFVDWVDERCGAPFFRTVGGTRVTVQDGFG